MAAEVMAAEIKAMRVRNAIAATGRIRDCGSFLAQEKRCPSAQKLARGQMPKTSQIGGVQRRTAPPIYARSVATPDYRKLIGAFNGAEQIRPLGPWRGAGAISGRRFPRDLAWNLCALRRDRCADSAGRAEILERRSAGSLRHTKRRAAAAFPRRLEGEGLRRLKSRYPFV